MSKSKSKSTSTALEYTLTNDVLFKMVFRDYPELLKHLVAELLKIPFDSIGSFTVKNPKVKIIIWGRWISPVTPRLKPIYAHPHILKPCYGGLADGIII